MPSPAILVVTGASGAGKTTAVREIEARAVPGVRCFYFDTIGVPAPADMVREYGTGEAWQAAMTGRWIARLVVGDAEVAVLDGQVRPSVVRAAVARAPAPVAFDIVLLDCVPAERLRRLSGPRGQPDLATPQMDAWAAYLRGQADALGLPVLDTSALTVAGVADALLGHVERLRTARRVLP
jgi:hypothetical protein